MPLNMVNRDISRPVVLYADDHRDAHALMSRAFAKAGVPAILIPATDGTEILQYLAKSRELPQSRAYRWPDLLLLDLKMPRLSGLELIQIIKASPELSGFPIVVFSASQDPVDLAKCKELGCDAFINSQLTHDSLIQLVRAMAVQFFGAPDLGEGPNFGSFCVPLDASKGGNEKTRE
jgi:CheY-like chemotaxis protein